MQREDGCAGGGWNEQDHMMNLALPHSIIFCLFVVFFQSKSNSELKAMFEQHYQYLVLLSGPLPSLQAALPKMTPMDGETGLI